MQFSDIMNEIDNMTVEMEKMHIKYVKTNLENISYKVSLNRLNIEMHKQSMAI